MRGGSASCTHYYIWVVRCSFYDLSPKHKQACIRPLADLSQSCNNLFTFRFPNGFYYVANHLVNAYFSAPAVTQMYL